MKRFKKILFTFLLLTMYFSASLPVSAAVKFSNNNIILNVGKTKKLKVTGTNKKAKWKSSNKKIATVTKQGKVKGIKEGRCKITATVGKNKYACNVIVKSPSTSVKVGKNIRLEIGDTATLIIPSASGKIKWKSSNKKVAKVNSKGVATGVNAGKCSITGTWGNNKYKFSVTVYGYEVETTPQPQPQPVQQPQDNSSIWQRNALDKAKSYLSVLPFSREGLIAQLEYEGFAYNDSVYAVDNCGANWYEQALKSALNYLNTMAFSKLGLIGQLEYEKFTPEQATYGVANCGANWYEQAVRKAREYLEVMSFSKDSLVAQLEYDQFTHEEAVYGVEQWS